MLAFGCLIVPERGVTRVTWSVIEFYTPLKFAGMVEDILIIFLRALTREVLVLVTTNCPPGGRGQGHVTF